MIRFGLGQGPSRIASVGFVSEQDVGTGSQRCEQVKLLFWGCALEVRRRSPRWLILPNHLDAAKPKPPFYNHLLNYRGVVIEIRSFEINLLLLPQSSS
jgi:hypothetical protein